MANEKAARAVFTGGMRFEAETGSGHHVVMDSPDVGDGGNSGPSPMELVLVALAGCTGMDVIAMLRKMRQDVTAYEVAVRGTQADEHPRVYTTVTVEHTVTGHNLNPDLVRRAVELSETRYCPVGATVGKTARITHVVTIVEE
ncbi:MAG TPA: OsmC family protein [Ktedonobacterales bacterium]|nr:OsmC family protein [Ktedonobacterales bacterium]